MSRFNLPVFQAATAPVTVEELVRQAQHAEGEAFRILGDVIEFEFGEGIVSTEFPRVMRGNRVWDVAALKDGGKEEAQEMVRVVDEAYAAQGLECRQWHFAGGLIPNALRAVLEERGFTLEDLRLWNLQAARKLEPRRDLMVIPARASLEKLAELTTTNGRAEGADEELIAQWAGAAVRQLDDLHTEGFLAMEGQVPVGAVYLLIFGEMGFIWNMYVLPEYQGKKIGTTLLERVIETAGRSRLKRVCLFCDPDNAAAKALYGNAGFVEVAPVPRMMKKRKP